MSEIRSIQEGTEPAGTDSGAAKAESAAAIVTPAPGKAPGKSSGKASAKPNGKPAATPAQAKPAESKTAAVAASVKAQSKAKAPAKPDAAKAPAKPAAAARAMAKPAAAPAKPDAAEAADQAKPRKSKLVRDTFSMPDLEYAVLLQVKKECLKNGFAIKKSELLRIGVALISQVDMEQLKSMLVALPKLMTGRPKK